MEYLAALTLLLAPTYAIRFAIHGLPSNLLMVWIFLLWILFSVWLIKSNTVGEFIRFCSALDKKILIGVSLFFLAGVISLFVQGLDSKKLAQFIVLFLQPIIVFFIFGYIFRFSGSAKKYFIITSYFLLAAAGAYAIIQYFTLIGLPQAWWGNSEEPKRALSFFGHPDFYSLFSAPLLAFLLPDLFQEFSIFNFQFSKLWKPILWFFGAVGLFLSLSRAGWAGLAIAAAVAVIVAGNKLIRRSAIIGAVIVAIIVLAVPNLRFRLLLPFLGEKSAVSRISLWHTGLTGISQSPILGLGISGFSNNWSRLNTDPNLDTHNFPHNTFLDFWVDLGILGLLSYTFICGLFLYKGFKNKTNIYLFGAALFLLCLLIQGQIDNPYFRNDLAVLFWMALSIAL